MAIQLSVCEKREQGVSCRIFFIFVQCAAICTAATVFYVNYVNTHKENGSK